MEIVVISSAFWNNRRVFMTGHTGFKGSWLALMLGRLNVDLTGYALAPPTSPALFEHLGIGKTLRDHRGDIGDSDRLCAALSEAKPEIVVHMAAQPLVRQGYAEPVDTYRTNVMGTVNLLEAVRQTPSVRVVVVVTTDKCYENKDWPWGYREVDRLGGRDPYSSSKACAELVASAYGASFLTKRGTCVVTARAGNVIGGGDFAVDRILPDAVRAYRANTALKVRNPGAVRPWQHVLEPLYGYLLLAETAVTLGQAATGGYNFGPGEASEQTVARLIDAFSSAFGDEILWETENTEKPHEAAVLRLDTARARSQLGWSPLLGFDESVAWTADWYRGLIDGEDVARLTFEQVDSYLGQCVRLTSPFALVRGQTSLENQTHADRRTVGS